MSPTRAYIIALRDGNYVYGFSPTYGITQVTGYRNLALPFKAEEAARAWVAEFEPQGHGLQADLIAGIEAVQILPYSAEVA